MPTHNVQRDNGKTELFASQQFRLATNPVDIKLLRGVVSQSTTRAKQPEKWYSEIGEIHFGINRGAKIAGYAKPQARKVNPDGSMGDVVDTGPAAKIASMVQSPYGGTRGLIERYFTLMKVPGDAYLIKTRENADGTGEHTGYDFIGASEINAGSIRELNQGIASKGIERIVLPTTGDSSDIQVTYIKPEDFLGRVWRPATKFVQLADSPMAALDTQCEILHLLTLGLKGKLLSRLALNGILYVPSEVNTIRSGAPKSGENPVVDNATIDQLIKAATWAVTNFEDPRSALPIFMSGPAQFADALRHIILDQEIYATDMALRAEMIDRILSGLDVQKAQTKGAGEQTHWNAWASSDDEMLVNIKPDLETGFWAMTRLIMNREMQDAGKTDRTVQQYMLWFDISDANVNVNLAEDARQASDRVLINDETARRATGFDEDARPEGDELVRQIGRKVNNPYLALYGLPEHNKIDWDMVATVGSTKKGPNEASPGSDPQANPGNVPGKKTGKSESDTPSRLKPAS